MMDFDITVPHRTNR